MSKKLRIFEETLKKAKEGELFNYDFWLKENGVNPIEVNLKHFERFFWKNPDDMAGNDKIIERVAKIVGLFLKDRKGIYHVPIIGVTGSGKTLLLNVIETFTKKIESNITDRVDVIGARNYLLQEINPEHLITSQQRDVIHFIDNCEKAQNIKTILENVLKLKGEGVYFTSWTPECWVQYSEEINEIFTATDEIIIFPIEEVNYYMFITYCFNSTMYPELLKPENGYPLIYPEFIDEKFAVNRLSTIFYVYTKGIPLISINLLIKCFEKTFLTDEKKMDETIISEVASEMGLKDLDERLNKLSELHSQILFKILIKTANKGKRPMELVKDFNLDKSTISYHLNTISEFELLEVQKLGKSKYYKIRENLIPFIQLEFLKKLNLKKN